MFHYKYWVHFYMLNKHFYISWSFFRKYSINTFPSSFAKADKKTFLFLYRFLPYRSHQFQNAQML